MDGAGQNIEIDPAAIHVWCDLVLGYLDGSVTVRLISEKGTPDQKPMTRFFSVADVSAKIAALAANAARNRRAVFIVPGTVKTAGTARAEDIRETGVILADLDEGDIEAKRSHLVRHLGEPSMEVASGGKTAEGQLKRHLFWRLTEAAAGDDLALVADLRQTLARKTGGDPSFASLHQPIRVAGTVHGKQGVQAPVRILARNACEYELADFADAVRTMPAMPGVKQEADPRPRKHYGVSASELMSRPIREGGQDDETRFGALSKVIGHWLRQVRSGRMSLHEAWIAVVNHNTALIRPPWDENRLRRDFEALLQRDIRDKGPMPEPTPVMEPSIEGAGVLPPEQSEDALATRFVGCHGANWKEVAAWGAWLRWTGTHWSRDEVGAVFQDIRLICRTEASGIDKPAEARRLASSKTIQAVQKIAAHDPSIARAPDDFDQHPMLLNTPGGILDLQTGALAPHDRGLLITQITQARPGQGCPIWIGFLETATGGDGELQAYLARVAGYSLTGSTKEQTFFDRVNANCVAAAAMWKAWKT